MTAPATPGAALERGLAPRWVSITSILPLAYAIAVIIQRWNAPDRGRTILWVAVAMIPFAFDLAFQGRNEWCNRVPALIWALPTLIAVLALIWQPVNVDLAPFVLFLLIVRTVVDGSTVDGVIVALASAAVMIAADVTGHFTGSFIWVFAIVLAWSGAFAFKSLLRTTIDLRAAQADLAERAAADERQRIAREIHDVIAHSLSVATLHITGARLAVLRDPQTAADALAQAERLTRDSLDQVRAVVGVLAPGGDGTAPSLPTADDIPELVAGFTDAGAPVELEVDGDLTTISPTAGLALFRVTQESLSNVVRHAPGRPAQVRIHVGDTVDLAVTNPLVSGSTPGDGRGRGIAGMRERAAAADGELQAGAEKGQWCVRMTLPGGPKP